MSFPFVFFRSFNHSLAIPLICLSHNDLMYIEIGNKLINEEQVDEDLIIWYRLRTINLAKSGGDISLFHENPLPEKYREKIHIMLS
jgi:hypothetical protein